MGRVQTRSLASSRRLFPPSPIVTTSRSLKNQSPPHNSLQWFDLPGFHRFHRHTASFARQPDIPIRAVGQLACGRQKILINTNKYKYYLQIQTQIQTNKQTHRFFCPATGHSIGRLCYWKAIRKKKADAKTSSLIPPEYTKSGPLQSIFVQFWILISNFKSWFLFCQCVLAAVLAGCQLRIAQRNVGET